MIKNRLFACYVALTGSLLWVDTAKTSEPEVPEVVVALIAEYAAEPRVVESSKRVHSNRMDFVRSLFFPGDHRRMQDLEPERYKYSHIAAHGEILPDICVNNVYLDPLSPHGPVRYFTHALNHRNNRASWNTENNHRHGFGLWFAEEKQTQRTQKNRALFGSGVVSAKSSASFFPKHRLLVVANENSVTTYDTTNQAYETIDDALNPSIAAEKQKSNNLRNFLIAGTVVGLAAHYPAATGKVALAATKLFLAVS